MFAKKNLVAAAALLAVAGAAQADVKLYGTLDMDVGSYEAAHAKGTSVRTTKVQSGDMITSFIGFAGSEDLGGGLKAEFALESFIGADTGSNIGNNGGGWWGRASNVALSGGFGKVAIGQYDNPLFTSGYTYNPFGSSMTFSPTMRHLNYIGQTDISGAGVGFDTGWINSLTYESPVMAGFQVIGQYAPKETKTAGTNNSYTLAGSYNMGPFSAMLTYVSAGVASNTDAYKHKEKVTDLGVSYDFGVLKAFGQYTYINHDAAYDSTSSSVLADDSKDKIWQLGVSVPVTANSSVMASFGQLKNTPKGADSTKNEVFSLAYDYVLSKRTDVYAGIMNERQTSLESGQSFAVGLRHSF
jgi:predicted porin